MIPNLPHIVLEFVSNGEKHKSDDIQSLKVMGASESASLSWTVLKVSQLSYAVGTLVGLEDGIIEKCGHIH